MSWYNAYSDTTKRLQQLLQSQPTLSQLLQFPDCVELLKAYQPRLLQYISNSQQLVKDMVKLITQPPLQTDSETRKYKLPLLMILAIESNTTCIINSFFKINPLTRQPYFLTAFYDFLTPEGELLPLLCGYFSQFNISLWNSYYKQTIDLIYEAKDPLLLLAKHSYSKAIVNTLLLYLNLDLTRNNISIPDRTQLKLQVLKNLYIQIRTAFETHKKQTTPNCKNEIIIENISEILIEIVQKYYLISDGKSMLQIVTNQSNISLLLDILMYGSSISLSVVGVVTWIMRYYSLSSFNTEDRQNLQLSKRNLQRLEIQPFVKRITQLLPQVITQITDAPALTLYHSKLLEIFNMSLELSSKKILEVVKKSKYIETLVSLLFKFEKSSIVHKQTEKLFQNIFNSDRLIYEDYRKYLFCSAQLIQITVGEYLTRIEDLNYYKENIGCLHEGYFSYLMRIIKIYSKIQTNDQEINESIMKRSQLWQKFSSFVLKPYQALCFKQLGSYDSVLQNPPLQFSIKYLSTGGLNNNQQINKKVLQEINQQENMQPFMTVQVEKSLNQISTKNQSLGEDTLFNVQEFNQPTVNSSIQMDITKIVPSPGSPTHPSIILVEEQKKIGQISGTGNNYQQFLSKQKVEVDKELKLQRTNSSEKRLSANKSRVTSPSPKKKKWDTNQEQEKPTTKTPISKTPEPEQKKQKISLTNPNNSTVKPPMIPINKAPPIHPHINLHSLSHNINSPVSSPTKIQNHTSPHVNKQQPELPLRTSVSQTVLSSITNLPKENELNSFTILPVFQSKSLSTSHLLDTSNKIQISQVMSKSAVNSSFRPIQILRSRCAKQEKPAFRRIAEKDKTLLNLIGFKF